MMHFNESVAYLSVDCRKIEAAYLATESMNFDAGSPIDMTALVTSDKDLLRAAFRFPLRFRLHGFQWHQGKNSAKESGAPRKGQRVQRSRITSINHRRTLGEL